MKLPYINEYVYDINKVIAVIEVKKNLFSKELYDAYYNLKSVINIAYPNSDMRIDMLRDAFTAISKMQLPEYNEINGLETKYQMLYHSLVVECFLPIRVIFGYEGFANELSLRSKFIMESVSVKTKRRNEPEVIKGTPGNKAKETAFLCL